jgi:hypothetical protein
MIYRNGQSNGKVVNTGRKVVSVPKLQAVVKTNKTPMLGTGRLASTDNVISWVLDNSASATARILMLGDAYGSIGARSGKSLVNPTSTSTGDTPAIQKTSFAQRPLLLTSLNLQTSSTAAQFSQPILPHNAPQEGGLFIDKPLLIGAARSSADQDPLVRVVNQTLTLDDENGTTFTVLPGEILTIFATVGEMIVR